MAIHTRGYVSKEITARDVKKVIENLFSVPVESITEYMTGSFQLQFTLKGEQKVFHVHVDMDIEEPRFTVNQTVISTIHSEQNVDIMKKIIEQYGGYLCKNDVKEEWMYVVEKPEQTDKEKQMMEAMIKIWDLTNHLPNCDAKHEIIRVAGSIIYADN